MAEFPQYRKYANSKAYFKILSNSSFEEINFVGKKSFIQKYEAKILPDRNRISDMLQMRNGHWVLCEAEEFEVLKAGI